MLFGPGEVKIKAEKTGSRNLTPRSLHPCPADAHLEDGYPYVTFMDAANKGPPDSLSCFPNAHCTLLPREPNTP